MEASKLNRLLDDAAAAGYEVTERGGVRTVTRGVRVNAKATRTVGLAVYEDGTAFRVDVDPAVAAGIRSVEVMRRVLGL